jgi:tetratricopeptide (TPR) repeat protein
MAPRRPKPKKNKKKQPESSPHPGLLLHDATSKLQEGDIDRASSQAKRALDITGEGGDFELPALNLLGQIHIELGELESARAYFLRAVARDENGAVDERIGGGPEKFLWLAQLSEDGGADSVRWFERGSASLRKQIQTLSELRNRTLEQDASLTEKKRKLAGALCAVAEVYMTDLSWEEDAERKCEALVTEAMLVAPEMAETWQTVANVRISQQRVEEAKTALSRSLALWIELPPESEEVPDFPTRVSLARLLLEVEMEQEALVVLERLVTDDDTSVEVWYLGGWGLYIMGQKQRAAPSPLEDANANGNRHEDGEGWRVSWISARQWLTQCLKLYEAQEYEDERLGEHARELLATTEKDIGDLPAGDDDDEDGWEDAEDSDGDEDMED